MKGGCQTRAGRTFRGARAGRAIKPGVHERPPRDDRRQTLRKTGWGQERISRNDLRLTTLAAAASSAAATRWTCGLSTRLVALPLFDRFTAESPVTADAEAGQPSLSEEAVDRRRMNSQVFRQFLDSENLIALSCLSHLGGFAWRRRFLRGSFFHSVRTIDARFHLQFQPLMSPWRSQDILYKGRLKLRAIACKSVKMPQAECCLCHF